MSDNIENDEVNALKEFINGAGFNENQAELYNILSNYVDEFENVHGIVVSRDKEFPVMATLPNKDARKGSVYVAEADIRILKADFSEKGIIEILMNNKVFTEYNDKLNGSSDDGLNGVGFHKPKYHQSLDSDLIGGNDGMANDGPLRGVSFNTGTVDGLASQFYLHLNPKSIINLGF
ncbi:hypothetical protein HQ529_01875 [Candidatus Woesearchaeota archaeon]|nr:hypothetical protein [Candidatus Woesearchaeota archaeon]